ncbi:MAG TPA: NAD(P)/FAD-dependent oxidoreductase [Candidatus Paceibacterota bacterium]|nr:NAD(P)/FAD-dependent oxidoreductase [Candidatus Paceibacterota bacterium]
MNEIYDVIVVGGGASGLMAAGSAAEALKQSGKPGRVLLLEKNKKMGEKLKITGGGRCNITNAEYDIRELLKHYGDAGKFLFSVFEKFGVKDTFNFFESRGLPLVVEERKRAFPVSHKALDVYNVLEKYVKEGGVEIKTGSAVTKVSKDGKVIVSVSCGAQEYFAKKFIFATGGASHKETGSTGDGFNWLRDLGHTVVAPTPSIVPLAVEDEWSKKLAGIALEDMKITFYVDGVKDFSKKGRILFTHFGLSGPLILNSASEVADLLPAGTVTAVIDPFPTEDLGAFEKRIIGIFDENKNKLLKNVLGEILPLGMAKGVEFLINLISLIDLNKQVNDVRVEERKKLVRLLKALPLTITGLMGDDRAVVSDGGVSLEEIDMRTMKSKVAENLYVTGDLLHINRPSGGYSLQLCWTTGYVAGGEVVA